MTVRKLRVLKYPNRDLPNDAKKYEGPGMNDLMDLRQKDIEFYKKTNICINGGVEFLRELGAVESGDNWVEDNCKAGKEFFGGNLSPFVDGYDFYRGIAVPCNTGTILLYSPHMQTWDKRNAQRNYAVYTLGNVLESKVEEVIQTYTEGVGAYIDKTLAERLNK